MRVFILEDDMTRVEQFFKALEGEEKDFADSVESALDFFDPPYDVIFLDHDLGGQVYVDSGEPNTGYQFVKEILARYDLKDTIVVIHSWNPVGAAAMYNAVKGSVVIQMPFGNDLLTNLIPALKEFFSEDTEREGVGDSDLSGDVAEEADLLTD